MNKVEFSPREKHMVATIIRRVENPPDDVLEEMERAADQRAYFKDCLLRGVDDAVSTNYVYRYIASLVGDVLARDPEVKITPRDKCWGPSGPPEPVVGTAETFERLANTMLTFGDFAGAMQEVAWDAHTVPIGFVKVIWSEDYHRDPIGAPLRGPQRQNAVYRRLYQEYKDKQFDKEDEKYQTLLELSDKLRAVAADQIDSELKAVGGVEPDHELAKAGAAIVSGELINPDWLPNVPLFQKFNFDVLDIEDVRWDWKLESKRGWFDQDGVGHRVRMTHNQIVEKFDLNTEEAEFLQRTEEAQDGSQTTEFREDIKDNESEDTLDVWEWQDNITGRVYVVTKTYPGFLDSYEPTVTWSKFFTIFPLSYNQVPEGFIGLSDVDMLRPLQDEINQYRTWKRSGLKAKLPRYGVPANIVSNDADLEALNTSQPFSFNKIGLNVDPSEFKNSIITMQADKLELGWFDQTLTNALTELQAMAGRPLAALGAAQSGVSATQTAFTSNQLGEMVSVRRHETEVFMRNIVGMMLEILVQTMDKPLVNAIVGPAAIWPEEARQSAFMDMNLQVRAHLDTGADTQQWLSNFSTFLQIAQSMGLMPDPAVLPEIAKEYLKLDISMEKWFPVPTQPLNPAGTPGPEQGSLGNAPASDATPEASLPGGAAVVRDMVDSATP